jgi:hypothetical protein
MLIIKHLFLNLVTNYCDQVKGNEMGGICVTHEGDANFLQSFG